MTDEPEVEYLDLDDLVALATALIGDPAPIRDVGLLGSAAARPRTTAFGANAYPDIWTKAASLLQSIVGNHALIDGNKRLSWLAKLTANAPPDRCRSQSATIGVSITR